MPVRHVKAISKRKGETPKVAVLNTCSSVSNIQPAQCGASEGEGVMSPSDDHPDEAKSTTTSSETITATATSMAPSRAEDDQATRTKKLTRHQRRV